MNWIEAVAAVFGVLSVWYARKENIRVFPLGIINVAIYVYICFDARLYANAGINVVYLFSNIYGWYRWSRTDEQNGKPQIRRNSPRQNVVSWLAVVLLYLHVLILLWYVNRGDTQYTGSYLPFIDSFNTAIFLVATLLMALKKVESWRFWIIGNIVSIPIYASQELYFTALQYLVFLLLALSGWREWKTKAERIRTEELTRR